MRLGNIISGQPFRAALRFLAVFLAIYLVASWLLIQTVVQTLSVELQEQVHEETVLLNEIYQSGGREALESALHDLKKLTEMSIHSAGVFDERGLSLAGPIALVPDFVGFASSDIFKFTKGAKYGEHMLLVTKYADATLVVGRSNKSLLAVKNRILWGLAIVGGLLSVLVLGLGAWASALSFQRLGQIEKSLRAFSNGDHAARLPVYKPDDQFDRISAQMNVNLDRLSKSIAAMQFTAAAIAHDLKTPLSHTQIAIHQAADACEAGENPIPKIEEALEETENLNAIFDTMLRITSIKSDSASGHFQPVDLGQLVLDVVDLLIPLAEENRQLLSCGEKTGLIANVDATMIQQLLVNLIQNAITHAGSGVEIRIAVTESQDAHVLTVSDNGAGIPTDQQDKITEAFVRLDSARTTVGSGLGLTLVSAIVEHHQGSLQFLATTPGLRVTVTLPKNNKC